MGVMGDTTLPDTSRPHIRADVKKYIESCDSCQRVKATNQKPQGLLKPLSIPSGQWEDISMDLITDVPESDGMDSIVLFTHKLTKMTHIAPTTKTSTARDIALLFLSKVWALHGMPKRMLHDRDTRFTSNFWTLFFALCGIKQLNSSAFHPDGWTNGAR